MSDSITWNGYKIVIIASDHDIASMLLAEQVEAVGLPVFYLRNTSFLHVSEKALPDADGYIILSRHSSAAGEPAFTVHSVGNFSPNEPKLGGKAATLGKAQAEIQTYLLHSLSQIAKHNQDFAHFDVVAEATHHGPLLLNKTVTFIEMGSGKEVWTSKKAAKIIAQALELFQTEFSHLSRFPSGAIGFGGGHYPRKVSDEMLSLIYSGGHIAPKYALQYLDESMIKQMLDNTLSSTKVEYALFDKKGMNRKKEFRELVTNLGLEVKEL